MKQTNNTVLIVDDNAELLQLLTDTLRLLGGYEVVRAEDGVRGLELYFEVQPICMIIDVIMPGLDGYQLVKVLRGDPQSAHTPLILLTALAQDHNRFAGALSGADHYLIKPVKPQELLAAVRSAIAVSETERRARLQSLLDEDVPEG